MSKAALVVRRDSSAARRALERKKVEHEPNHDGGSLNLRKNFATFLDNDLESGSRDSRVEDPPCFHQDVSLLHESISSQSVEQDEIDQARTHLSD